MMLMNRRLAMAGMAAVPAFGPGLPARARDKASVVEAALDTAFAETAPVGLGVTLISREGVVAQGVRGVRRRGEADPVTVGDAWHLGSNTKAMTATVFARLVDQGRASWDLKIVDALPGEHDPAWADTRVIDFMHHRAGLKDDAVMGQAWLMAARADPASLPEQRRDIADKALSVPPDGTPGEFAYGNANYVLVGAVIEAITGKDWETVMREQIFAPLDLASAGFGPPSEPAPWGHRHLADQDLSLPPSHPGADNPQALGPAGTVHMTMSDYARFLSAFLHEGGDLVTPASYEVLSTPVTTPPPAYACGWIVLQQAWARGTPDSRGVALAHDGSNTAWYATAVVAPEIGLGLIAVSNDGTAGARACPMVVQAVIRGLMAEARTTG